MAQFEKVSRFQNDGILVLPQRKTQESAGYDFMVAEDIVLTPYMRQFGKMLEQIEDEQSVENYLTLDEVSKNVKNAGAKPALVATGIKCQLDKGTYLELSVRSSCPLKHWIVLANGVGIIDADYYNNPSNEGEIFFQVINFSPYFIQLKKSDIIGQGIIKHYDIAKDELAPTSGRTGGFGSTSK